MALLLRSLTCATSTARRAAASAQRGIVTTRACETAPETQNDSTDSAQRLERLKQYTPAAVAKFNDLVAVSGSGSYLYDAEGRQYLDFHAGIGVVSTGHSHPALASALSRQASELLFAQQNCVAGTPAAADAIDALIRILPAHLDNLLLVNSGSEAVDNAVKIARNATGRQTIVVFDGSYHGRTIGAMSLTTSKTIYHAGMHPLMSGVMRAPYPYCLHCPVRQATSSSVRITAQDSFTCCNAPLNTLQDLLKMSTAPSDIAAFILEPVLGEGGIQTPPKGFLPALRRICDEHGILLIFDEVQSGAGRTGKWWAYEQFHDGDAQPDIVTFAKGIGSGVPVAGLAGRSELFRKLKPGSLGGTYGAGPLACTAVATTVQIIEEEGLLANAEARGAQLLAGLRGLAERFPVLQVRGVGLMLAMEFEGPAGCASKVCAEAFKRGLLLITAGSRETIRFLPPLTLSAEEVDEGLDKLGKALEAAF